MADVLLGISGRIEVGETLTAAVASGGGTPVWQWQALVNGTWVNVGAAGAQTYVVPLNAVGVSYRLTATSGGQTFYSASTSAATADTNKAKAPTLTGSGLAATVEEGVAGATVFSFLAFADADKGNYGGGSLTVLNTQNGSGNLDTLSIRFAGTASGQFSYNAATKEVLYAFTGGSATVIGTLDAMQDGVGTSLKVLFNANATKAVVDALVNNVTFANNDDSPVQARFLTLVVTDPTGGSAQRVVAVNIQPQDDAPVFAGATSFLVDENQAFAATITATDPDQEATAQQGMTYSLAAGAGDADNTLFVIEAATGALRFQAAPDFEGAGHSAQYSVRVRATDVAGTASEQVIGITVGDVNEAPVAQSLTTTAQEDGPAVSIAAAFIDPDAGDSQTISIDPAGMRGSVVLDGQAFIYSANGAFENLGAGQSATDSFSYTVTDAAGLSSTATVTVNVLGINDLASLSGTFDATYVEDEGSGSISGAVIVTDADDGEAQLLASSQVGARYGVFEVTAGGDWTYAVDSALVQTLGAGVTAVETFTVSSVDGTASGDIRIVLHGSNDAPTLAATAGGAVTEAGVLPGGELDPGVANAAGVLVASDADTGDVLTFTGSAQGLYGSLTVDGASGEWAYALDNASAATQSLRAGALVQETFTVAVTDSQGAVSTRELVIDVSGRNDAPVITGGDVGAAIDVPQERTGIRTAGLAVNDDESAMDSAGRLIIALANPDSAAPELHRLNADGSEDAGFSNAILDYGVSSIGLDAGGRILAWGYGVDNYTATAVDFAVRRFNADGTPDATFGTGGKVLIDFDGSYDYGENVMFEASGKILVAGSVTDSATGASAFAITRLHQDGSQDASFGNDGWLTFDTGPWMGSGLRVAMDGEGRLVLFGQTADESSGVGQISLARYMPDGTLDTTFGVAGHATVSNPNAYGELGLVIGPADELLLGWTTFVYNNGTSTRDIRLARVTVDGVVDAVFGDGGQAVVPVDGVAPQALDLTVDAQGRILVGFTATDPVAGLSVARFNPDGTADTSFSGDGVASVESQPDFTASGRVYASPDGTVVITGAVYGMGVLAVAASFTTDGTPNTGFGDAPDMTASGNLYSADVDQYWWALEWAGSAEGLYGSFSVNGGVWTYDLDEQSVAALPAGQVLTEVFTATVTDDQGATASQEVVITIVGSYEPSAL